MQKLSDYFDIKRYLHFKNISHEVNIDYFIWESYRTIVFSFHGSGKLQLFTNKYNQMTAFQKDI